MSAWSVAKAPGSSKVRITRRVGLPGAVSSMSTARLCDPYIQLSPNQTTRTVPSSSRPSKYHHSKVSAELWVRRPSSRVAMVGPRPRAAKSAGVVARWSFWSSEDAASAQEAKPTAIAVAAAPTN
jgi:hypothetical protein